MAAASQQDDTILGFPRYPPFQLERPRFPQETFTGRYLHYLEVIDPRTLFYSKARVDASLKLLSEYQAHPRLFNVADEAVNAKLWEAQKVKQAIFHPDTGEKIFPAFRMSGFVPFGWITVTGMLLPNPSWPTLLFWQWMNQSHNAMVNYANRNATKQQPFSTYAKAYFAAVSAAIGLSGSLTWFIRRSGKLSATKKLIVQRFVPLPATSLASTLNVLCMRGVEAKTGIDVYDAEGNVVGASKEAAKKAIKETAITRAFLPVPLLLIPPCVMPILERFKALQRSPSKHLIVNALVCTLSFAFSLPIALALFPQRSSISASQTEEGIRELCEKKGVHMLYYNRGT